VLRMLESLTGEIDALLAPRLDTNAALRGNRWGNSRPRSERADTLEIIMWAGFSPMPEEGLEPPTRGL
jgi:hypothetical protein